MEGYAMEEDTVVGLPRPGGTVEDDPLLAVLREGARQMLSLAIEAEVAAFVAVHADRVDETGRRRVVRHGHAPKRSIQTGIGPIEVQRPRVRDRGADDESERIRFTSAVLPAYLRRTRNVEELLPWLYLKGISTGQFEDTLKVLLGPDAPGLSAATIRRLVATWQDEHQRWQARDLSAKRYLYVWADGVYFAPRLEHDRQCILVLIGADAQAARRNSWRSTTASGRASRAGTSCWSACATRTASSSTPSSPSAMVRSASGRRRERSGPRSSSSGVGCTRWPTS